MPFQKTKTITLEGSAITTATMEGDALDSQTFGSPEEAGAEFSNMFTEINDDPTLRIEMQKQDVWTVYEQV